MSRSSGSGCRCGIVVTPLRLAAFFMPCMALLSCSFICVVAGMTIFHLHTHTYTYPRVRACGLGAVQLCTGFCTCVMIYAWVTPLSLLLFVYCLQDEHDRIHREWLAVKQALDDERTMSSHRIEAHAAEMREAARRADDSNKALQLAREEAHRHRTALDVSENKVLWWSCGGLLLWKWSRVHRIESVVTQ
jgi:hypothetical protein